MQIGLIGAPGAGKDVVADYLVKNKGFTRFAFADQIKKEFYAHSKFSEEDFKLSRGTALEQEIRKKLWEYSARYTKQDELHFISPVMQAIQDVFGPVIITDVRTPAELRITELFNFKIVLILRKHKEELKGEYKLGLGKVIPGTKIPLARAIDFPIFWNDADTLEKTYVNIEEFYQELKENQ